MYKVVNPKYKLGYKPFSPYNDFYYCSHCSLWIPKDKAVLSSNGRILCPYCHKPLRVKGRNKR